MRLGSGAEARWLGERASGHEDAAWLAHLDDAVPARSGRYFLDLLDRRAGGEPLQYVLGRWAFRGLDLFVDRRVLIPRPETETVVEVALEEARRLAGGAADAGELVAVDLGTGSGAIALSLAAELPRARVWATDRSGPALAVARANLAGLGAAVAGRVRLAQGSWFDALPPSLRGSIQLLVSNPPYVAEDEELPAEVADWEPEEALRAGPTGLEAVGEILSAARSWLARPGAVVLELAPHRAAAAAEVAVGAGFAPDHLALYADLAGRPRTLVARCRR